jgi:hypothetical protein
MSPHNPDVEDTRRGVQSIMMAGLMRYPTPSAAVCFEELWF